MTQIQGTDTFKDNKDAAKLCTHMWWLGMQIGKPIQKQFGRVSKAKRNINSSVTS